MIKGRTTPGAEMGNRGGQRRLTLSFLREDCDLRSEKSIAVSGSGTIPSKGNYSVIDGAGDDESMRVQTGCRTIVKHLWGNVVRLSLNIWAMELHGLLSDIASQQHMQVLIKGESIDAKIRLPELKR